MKEFYGDSVLSTDLPGRPSLVCFTGVRDAILTDKWYNTKKQNTLDEKHRIVTTPAKIIGEDIRSKVYDCDAYPTPEEMVTGGHNLILESLALFKNEFILPKHDVSDDDSIHLHKSLCLQH